MNASAIWFADTSFWIAVSQKSDQYHRRASAWSSYLTQENAFILTTEAVLWEWMNALANSATRRSTAEGYRRCHQDLQIEVVPFDVEMIAASARFYEARNDKDWEPHRLPVISGDGTTPDPAGSDNRSPFPASRFRVSIARGSAQRRLSSSVPHE